MPQITKEQLRDRKGGGESLRGASLVRADLSGMNLVREDLTEANLRMADLRGTDLTESQLAGCFLSGANLTEAQLVGANLVEASIIGAILAESDLSRADLSGADLTGANLRDAQLAGAYLVGTFLNESDLSHADLSGAYVRMAQMNGADLAGAVLDGADLSNATMTGVRLDSSSLVNAALTGAVLSASTLVGCDLRGANLTEANLTGCNLTGAKLFGIKFAGAKLDDAWAEWVDLSPTEAEQDRASLEEAFVGIVGKPMLQILVEGQVGDDVWAEILSHLRQFQHCHPQHSDASLKAIHRGKSSSALFLEADHELSLAAYLSDFADIMGRGAVELFDKLASAVGSHGQQVHVDGAGFDSGPLDPDSINLLRRNAESRVEALERTAFWNAEKAVAILTGDRQVWLEVASSQSLTIRPPHGAALGLDMICGRFVTDNHASRRQQAPINEGHQPELGS